MQTKIKFVCAFFFLFHSFIHDFSFPPNQPTIFSILMDFCHVNTKLCFIFTFHFCCCCCFFLGQLKQPFCTKTVHKLCAHILIVGLAKKNATRKTIVESLVRVFGFRNMGIPPKFKLNFTRWNQIFFYVLDKQTNCCS